MPKRTKTIWSIANNGQYRAVGDWRLANYTCITGVDLGTLDG